MKCREALLLLLCLVHYPCLAQLFDEKKFAHYAVTKGLSDNYITSLAQDEWGYLWIGTTNGLNRFDGKEFKQYFQTPGKQGLLSDHIKNVISQGKRLLVYGNKGTQWLNLFNNRFTNLMVPELPSISPFQNDVAYASFTDNGILFESTFTGAYAFDSAGKMRFRYDHWKNLPGQTLGKRYGKEIVKLNGTQFLHIDNQNSFSIYDSRKNSYLPIKNYRQSLPVLYSLNGRNETIRLLPGGNKIIFYSVPSRRMGVYDIKKDKVEWQPPAPAWLENEINWQSRWLTLNDTTAIIYGAVAGLRLVHIDANTGLFSYQLKSLFENDIVTAALLDREGRLWIGTRNGLYVQKIKRPQIQDLPIPLANNNPLKIPISYNSFFRKDDLLYVGNYHFLPVAVLDAKTYTFKRFLSFENLSPRSNQIWNIIHFKKDTLWFGTQDGLVWYSEKSNTYGKVALPGIDSLLNGRSVSLLFKDAQGDIWLQTYWGSGLIHYNPMTKKLRRFANDDKNNFLPLRVVNFATEDAAGNVWFGENGLIRWNRAKDAFDTLMQSYAGFNGHNSKIYSLCSNKDGQLVFSNQNNGVLRFDPETGHYEQLSSFEGLPENSVLSAISLPNDQLWIVSRNFITVADLKTGQKISYSYADNLPQSAFNFAMHDPYSHRVLFGYDDKVVWIKDAVMASPKPKLSFYIDALQVANDTSFIFPTGKIELSYKQNDITLHFSSLNFEDPQSDRFAYRINNESWESLGNENILRFSSLSPGTYNLAIKNYSMSDSGLENIRKLELVIHYPFWQTTIFYILMSLLAISAIYIIYRWRIRQVKQKADLEKQFAELEIKGLHAQMNPHFVFNCLNGIREMILNGENQQASHYLSKFAHLMRLTLTQSSKPFISLKETVDYLHRYLEMEQVRSTHFTYSIEVENVEERSIYLPPMLIQPFLENAVWHGSAAKQKPLFISIRFFQKDGYLFCIVNDNGLGIEASLRQKGSTALSHQPVGIENVRQRIKVLNEKYNLHSSLTIEDKSQVANCNETGTRVTFQLHIKNSRI